jgi:hypothetical protein
MRRVDGLLELHGELHGRVGRPERHVSDVLRGAFVLAFAALDAVVLEAVVDSVPFAAQRGLGGDALAKWISSSPSSIVDGISAGDPTVGLEEVVRRAIGHGTFQKASKIEGVLRESLGCEPPWEGAATRLSRTTGEVWSGDDVRKWLDLYVERRNRIAHNGDRSPGRRAADPIRFRYVQTAAELARAVGQSVCLVVEQRINTA